MTKEEALLFLKEKRKTMNVLNSVISMVYWDMEVVAPIESIEHWGEILGYLSAQYHQLTTDTRIEEALEVLAVSIQELDQYEKRLVEIFSDLYQQNKKIPESLKRDLSMAIAVGKKYWKKAKEAGTTKFLSRILNGLLIYCNSRRNLLVIRDIFTMLF